MGGFFPGKKYGGPPVSVDNFCSLMEKEHECFVVTLNHDMGETIPYDNIEEGWNNQNNCKVLYLPKKYYSKNSFKSVIEAIHPDLLYLQGLFQSCVIPCLHLAKKHNLRVLLAPRGELCKGAIAIKKYKKLPFILYLRSTGLLDGVSFQSTSEEETYGIKKYLDVEERRIIALPNIPSIPRKEYAIHQKQTGQAKLVFISRIHPKKNLLFAIQCLGDVKGQVTFDIFGPQEDKSYWRECEQAIIKLPNNITVNYCGLVSHDMVHDVFSHYDAFLFPTLSENYGHVIAEALIVGCPAILSDQTPWNDIENSRAGWVCRLDNKKKFCSSLQEIVDFNNTQKEEIAINAKKYIFQKEDLISLKERYFRMIKDVINA